MFVDGVNPDGKKEAAKNATTPAVPAKPAAAAMA